MTYGEGIVAILLPDAAREKHEWQSTFEALHKLPTRGLFEFLWDRGTNLEEQTDWLTEGVQRIVSCTGTKRTPVLLIGHGAGAVLAAETAARLSISTTSVVQVYVLMVDEGLDVGSSQLGPSWSLRVDPLPRPAQGVTLIHLRREGSPEIPMQSSPATYRLVLPQSSAPLDEASLHLGQGDFARWAQSLPDVVSKE